MSEARKIGEALTGIDVFEITPFPENLDSSRSVKWPGGNDVPKENSLAIFVDKKDNDRQLTCFVVMAEKNNDTGEFLLYVMPANKIFAGFSKV